MTIMEELQGQLLDLQDLKYKQFQQGLVKNIDSDTIIGVRVPFIRKLAKKYQHHPELMQFLHHLPHQYYEENMLHAILLTGMKDYETCLLEYKRFLPYIDNWAVCDVSVPRVFATHKKEILKSAKQWIASQEPYTIRYGVNVMMQLFLDEDFQPEFIEKIAYLQSDEYYVNMAIAWYMATALAKQWDATIPHIESGKMPKWTHNKTIQKAKESFRITEEQKVYLNSLKKIC